MVDVQVHPGKNRLYVTIVGDVTEAQLIDAHQRLVRESERLRPGFDAVNDISRAGTIPALAAKLFEDVAGPLSALGVSRVVRVVGRSADAAKMFEKVSRKLGFSSAFLAYSVEEAERLLDGPISSGSTPVPLPAKLDG